MPFRVGNHWGTTLVWQGSEPPDENGRRPDDKLLGMINYGDTSLAERIVRLLNEDIEKYLTSSQLSTFMDDLRAGRTTADQIGRYISAWGATSGSARMPLREFLGMTWSDFAHWSKAGTILSMEENK